MSRVADARGARDGARAPRLTSPCPAEREALDGPDLAKARELLSAELPSLKVSRSEFPSVRVRARCQRERSQTSLGLCRRQAFCGFERYGRVVASWIDTEGRKSAVPVSALKHKEKSQQPAGVIFSCEPSR